MEGLELEQRVLVRERVKLLARHGEGYAVVVGSEVLGVYPEMGEAYAAGVAKCGPRKPFLLKRIEQEEVREEMPAYVYGLMDPELP